MRALALSLCAALFVTGCVEKIAESRVKSALQEAGLSERNSSCMAGRMVDRLTISQLRKLENLKPREGEPRKPATLSGYVERVRRVGDAEVLTVTSSSAALCAVGLG
uniref:hypothetical protein n=1 Tax=Parerythrobacter lutipelagi TaxID=1964208 RepID=UPI0010F7E118|nr:hypothetical protein [Parerythrobacter lutipelagi]